MRILISGGTGLIGSRLSRELLRRGHEVSVFTRNLEKARKILGEGVKLTSELESLNGFDAVVNLAGEPIGGKRWTRRQKDILLQSRCVITEKLSDLINSADKAPGVFISGSAVGYYGPQGENIVNENSSFHDDFLHGLCQKWESAAMAAEGKARVCVIRTGIVLSCEGGMLSALAPLFRFGLGAVIGSGRQYMPWIHISDMVSAIIFLLCEESARGAYNLCAPVPVTNRGFSKEFAKCLKRPCFFRVPEFVMNLLMGEAAIIATKGQRAIPEKLCAAGYKFEFPEIKGALKNLFSA